LLSYSDFENMDVRITNILSQEVSVVDDKSEFPPTMEELEDSNKTYSLDAAVLFVDIRHSTKLMDENTPETMVKIYRTFMRSMVECVRKNGGVTRQFLGDRIMGIFKSLPDDELSASDKAIYAAIDMQTSVDYILNKNYKDEFNNQLISCGIGIDYGNILVTKVGMHGLENNEEKEDELDFVWVGNATNHASKYADLAPERSIFISESCYLTSNKIDKAVWKKASCEKGKLVLNGYMLQDMYSPNIDGFGEAFFTGDDKEILGENTLVVALHELEKQYETLIQREKECAVKEDSFNNEKNRLLDEVEELNNKLEVLSEKNDDVSSDLKQLMLNYYDCLYKIINSWHCSSIQYKQGFEKYTTWKFYIEEVYRIGGKLGYTKDQITDRCACGLMEIYMFFNEPEKAYEALLVMASKNNYWVNLREDVIGWAKGHDKLSTLIYRIEGRLDRFEIPVDKRNDFYGYTKKLREIRGF